MQKLFAVRTIILTIGFGLFPADRVTAQTFTVLHGITSSIGDSGLTNSDGMYPHAG